MRRNCFLFEYVLAGMQPAKMRENLVHEPAVRLRLVFRRQENDAVNLHNQLKSTRGEPVRLSYGITIVEMAQEQIKNKKYLVVKREGREVGGSQIVQNLHELGAVQCIETGRDGTRVDTVLNRLAGYFMAVRRHY